jgi:small subunit ribosomal protein S6
LNDYEILLMIDPELPEERGGEIVSRTRELVEKAGGTWEDHQPWGRRKLAYEIDHKPEGVYHLLTFTCEPTALDEISRILKITDGVMRHMATRRPRPHRRGETPAAAPVAEAPAEYAESAAGPGEDEAAETDGEE